MFSIARILLPVLLFFGAASTFGADITPTQLCRRVASTVAEEGEAEFHELVAIFNSPAKALAGLRTTPEEDARIVQAAFRRLTLGTADKANASHIMDLILVAQDPKVRAALEKAGITPLQMVRNILLHDLGKQYNDPALVRYRAFLETVFPDATKNFASTRIMPHEFGSMIVLAEVLREAGIDPAKAPRLQALIAGHNAGYRPSLNGFHFWVAGFAWPAFARTMQEVGVPLPDIYTQTRRTNEGGNKETTALTALDRLVSVTLASQEKFSMMLVNQNKWNTETLVKQFRDNLRNVPPEVASVVSRFDPHSENQAEIQSALDLYMNRQKRMTKKVADALENMATRAPAPTSNMVRIKDGVDLGSSIPYQTKDKTWYRVNGLRELFVWNKVTKEWEQDKQMTMDSAPARFFKIIYRDVGYEVPDLAKLEGVK